MSHTNTQDSLVEHSAIQLLAASDCQTMSALEEVFGVGGTLGRETEGEAVLVLRLRAVLVRLLPLHFEKILFAN